MRIVFFGASELGYRCCRQLFEGGENVVGIFSIPQEFRISYSATPVRNVTFHSFEELADTHGVPLVYVTTKMGDAQYLQTLQEWRPDFGLVIGWYYMIPAAVRNLFGRGVAGIHASLLPKYRGGAPLPWAIINGETKTGVTLFYFEGGVDTGDIIAQKEVSIADDDTIKSLYEKATQSALELVRDYVPLIGRGTAPRIPQDHEAATQFPQRKPEDGLIDWRRQTGRQVYDWVRAQTQPYPGAFTYLNGEKLIVWETSLSDLRRMDAVPGSVETHLPDAPDAFGVWCIDRRMLKVHKVGMPGGESMSGAEFLRERALERVVFDNVSENGGGLP
jgi:methionyl-tRNA formyltransferase